ncbi:MAG TPA: GNAT family N-acetyltransferase, partial [Bacillota bacterium]
AIDPQQGKEHRILFTYLYTRTTWQPDLVRVGETGGRLVTAVGFFPQKLYFDKVLLPVWAISPVVTHPQFRNAGIGGNCLINALEQIKERGITAVFLWGIPTFYPRYGFVPLLPRYKTRLRKGQLRKENLAVKGSFRPVQAADLDAIATLYDRGNSKFWLQPQRTNQWWRSRFAEMGLELAALKEVPYPVKENFMVWENSQGKVAGYLYFNHNSRQQQIEISEAAVFDYRNAVEMVKSFCDHFLPDGYDLIIRGTPQHYLNMAAYRWGGTHLNPAPLAGMIKVIDWPAFLHQITPLLKEQINSMAKADLNILIPFQDQTTSREIQLTTAGIELNKVDGQLEALSAPQLTRLLFGLYDRSDWALLKLEETKIERLFPAKYPFIWDANYLY